MSMAMDVVSYFMLGFLGGLTGTVLAIQGLRQYFARHYLRYYNTKDYESIKRHVYELLGENRRLKVALKEIRHDIFELFNIDSTNDKNEKESTKNE